MTTVDGLTGFLLVAVIVPLAPVLISGTLMVLAAEVGGVLMMVGGVGLTAEEVWTLIGDTAGF